MRIKVSVVFSLLFTLVFSLTANAQEVTSPSGKLSLSFRLTEAG